MSMRELALASALEKAALVMTSSVEEFDADPGNRESIQLKMIAVLIDTLVTLGETDKAAEMQRLLDEKIPEEPENGSV